MSIGTSKLVKSICVDLNQVNDPATEILQNLPPIPYAFLIVLVSPAGDLQTLSATLQAQANIAHVIGARTAGEICDIGYSESKVVVLGFPASHFEVTTRLISELDKRNEIQFGRDILQDRQTLQTQRPDFENEFAFLLADGLSMREETLVLAISTALGSTQLFGGSSGDGLRFESAPIVYDGEVYENAAVLVLARSRCEIRIFREGHFDPSEKRLVVTGAIPEQRLVTEINAESAAPEYARIVGIDPEKLSPFIFASHPIVVSVGDQHHVRAIQKVEDNNNLRFFSSIDEGMVLTVAKASNIGDHLESVLEDLNQPETPDLIFVCDCILRRLEAEQNNEFDRMSALLSQHRVYGFSTYGEQHNMLHVNQTLTGIAIYPPKS
ncbi:MAG: FIST N-terminal domain-containing protein [Thiolinea sp.]